MYLVSQAFVHRMEIYYWRERNDEVDFVLRRKGKVVALEVKSNAEKNTKGLETFKEMFSLHAAFVIGDGGMSAEDFLTTDLRMLFS